MVSSTYAKETGCVEWMRPSVLLFESEGTHFLVLWKFSIMCGTYQPYTECWLKFSICLLKSDRELLCGRRMKKEVERRWIFFATQGSFYNLQNLRARDGHEDIRGQEWRFCVFNFMLVWRCSSPKVSLISSECLYPWSCLFKRFFLGGGIVSSTGN